MSGNLDVEKMIAELCCSDCGTRFRPECIRAMETQSGAIVLRIVCRCCGKKYVIALMDITPAGFSVKEINESDFRAPVQSGGCAVEERTAAYFEQFSPISYDDVLEAHEFIQNFEENWRRFKDKGYYNPT